jgi:DNA (cytosine-5)-methyltransferase 1
VKYSFIDLFAGIGGFRLGFESQDFKCIFSSEIDEHAQEVYKLNFKDTPFGDITKIDENRVPNHDILLAGFPCQPFSIAGEKKGFCDTRGTMFFEIERIIKAQKPKAIVLENVKHFKNHDKGNTLKTVLYSLENLGYTVSWQVLNAKDFGVAQNRERTIIVASLNGIKFDFSRLKKQKSVCINDILENDGDFEYLNDDEYTIIDNPKVQKSGLIFVGYRNKKIRSKGVRENTLHLSRVHKQPNRIYDSKGTHPTLSSQESSGRYFVYQNDKVRKLTLKECFRLMGFPDDFKLIGSKAKLYNRVGNSIVVPLVKSIAKEIEEQILNIDEHLNQKRTIYKETSLFDYAYDEVARYGT